MTLSGAKLTIDKIPLARLRGGFEILDTDRPSVFIEESSLNRNAAGDSRAQTPCRAKYSLVSLEEIVPRVANSSHEPKKRYREDPNVPLLCYSLD